MRIWKKCKGGKNLYRYNDCMDVGSDGHNMINQILPMSIMFSPIYFIIVIIIDLYIEEICVQQMPHLVKRKTKNIILKYNK